MTESITFLLNVGWRFNGGVDNQYIDAFVVKLSEAPPIITHK